MVKKIAVVSLSRGILGEPFVAHEVKIGLKRLEEMGIEVQMMPHALKGLEYVEKHPEKRAEDLLAALRDDSVDMILSAIGGEDTYRLLPYLFEHDELKNSVSGSRRKIFLGYSDTTFNHFMFHKVGVPTFYGQAFLSDVCELEPEMLPYTRRYFEELIASGSIREIRPSEIWYEGRTDFSEEAVGTLLSFHKNQGFELLRGESVFKGEILGGCVDSMYDMFHNERFPDIVELCDRYGLFPSADDWKGKILLLETSEEKASPEKYRTFLQDLKRRGVLDAVSGILMGKPMDETYFGEYKQILIEETPSDLPILANVNIGHALPRSIIPFGVNAVVDAEQQVISFPEETGR